MEANRSFVVTVRYDDTIMKDFKATLLFYLLLNKEGVGDLDGIVGVRVENATLKKEGGS